MSNICSEEISVIVQGPIHKTRTKKCLKSIRKQLPNAEIILSTWEDADVEGLDYDVLVLNKEPITVQQKKFTTKVQLNNMNRMIVSTNNGLAKATKKYILKLRSDSHIDNTRFLEAYGTFPKRCEQYKLFDRRILASTLFSKLAVNKHKVRTEIAFHVSDWWFFGLAEDVKKLLLSAEVVDEPYFSNYFGYPENKYKDSVYEKFDWQFAPEQYIGYSCFSNFFDDIRMEDCSDVSDLINKKSQICMANNFIFLEYKQSGIRNLKYSYSTNELLSGDQYLDLYSFYLFEQEYKKYCDSNYVPTAKNLILSDKEKGYRILRFYKHLFKLIDVESPFIVKLEQLFFGIPISGITLIPTLIKILKERKNLNNKGRK